MNAHLFILLAFMRVLNLLLGSIQALDSFIKPLEWGTMVQVLAVPLTTVGHVQSFFEVLKL